MKWIIEKGLFLENEDKLMKTLKDKDIEAYFLPYIPFDDELVSKVAEKHPGTDYVFYGSLNFANKLRELNWKGMYADHEKYACTSYYPAFQNEVFNYDYLMMPFGDISIKEEFIFNTFYSDKVFIRPDSVLKQFIGQVVSQHNMEPALDVMGFYDTPANCLSIISSCKKVIREYRFVVVKGKVVTGSLYHDFSRTEEVLREPCRDTIGAQNYAQHVTKYYSPEDVWILDICEDDKGQFKVLEIGCFAFAGLYGCDMDIIVDEIQKLHK